MKKIDVTLEHNLRFGSISKKKLVLICAIKIVFGALFLPLTILMKLIDLLYTFALLQPPKSMKNKYMRSIEGKLHVASVRESFLKTLDAKLPNTKTEISDLYVKSPLGFQNHSYGCMIRNKQENNINIKDKKITIYIGATVQRIDTHLDLMAPHIAHITNQGEDFYYAGHALRDFSSLHNARYSLNYDASALIRCAVSHIKHVLDLGYNPENIKIVGFSVGGGISAEAIHRFAGYKLSENNTIGVNRFFGGYHNVHSFNTFSNAAAGVLARKVRGHMDSGRASRFIMHHICQLHDMNLHPARCLSSTAMPVKREHVHIYTAKQDTTITPSATLASCLQAEKLKLLVGGEDHRDASALSLAYGW